MNSATKTHDLGMFFKHGDIIVYLSDCLNGNTSEAVSRATASIKDKADRQQTQLAIETKIEATLQRNAERLDDLLHQLEEAVEAGEYPTKVSQKTHMSSANDLLGHYVVDRLKGEAIHAGSEYRDVRSAIGLPMDLRLHTVSTALKKTDSFIRTNRTSPHYPLAKRIKEILTSEPVNGLITLANKAKKLPVAKKLSKSQLAEQAHQKIWRSLPKASVAVVNELMESIKSPLQELTDARTKRLVEIAKQYKEEVASIQAQELPHREKYKLRSELLNKQRKLYTESVVSMLSDTPEAIRELIQKDTEFEREKILHLVTAKLGSLTHVENAKVVRLESGIEGVDCYWELEVENGKKTFFSIQSIFAGGYNIQRLHTRTTCHLTAQA